MGDEARPAGLSLLAAMGRPRAPGGDAAISDAPEEPDVAPDAPAEAEITAAADVRSAIRQGSDEDFARALRRFMRAARIE